MLLFAQALRTNYYGFTEHIIFEINILWENFLHFGICLEHQNSIRLFLTQWQIRFLYIYCSIIIIIIKNHGNQK